MSKTLKKWNGRASGHKRGTFYVAAYTQKQAAELISRAAGYRDGDMRCALGEIQSYYSPVWGNPMDGIEPTDDPILLFRSASYATSFTRRLRDV